MALPWFVKIRDGQPTLDLGAMRHSITVQSFGPTSPPSYDEAGPVRTWAAFADGMAAIGGLSSGAGRQGMDVQKGGQVVTQLPIQVGVWAVAFSGITPSMRVVSDNGSTYVIESIEDILDMGVVLIINCIALSNNL